MNNDFIKATSLLLNPVGYPMRVAEKWWTLRKTKREQGESRRTDLERPGVLQVLGPLFYPPIHGTYSSHWTEYLSYRRERWRAVFTHRKLVWVADVPLLANTQFGFLRFRFLPQRLRLGQRGLFSSRAFVLRKAAPAPEPASP